MSVTQRQQQTPDEIISVNVRRLRKAKNLSVIELASLLKIGKHAVYDYERPRRDHQHAFRFSELVDLCAGLDCTLFELVLPESDIKVALPPWVLQGPRAPFESGGEVGWSVGPPTRRELSWLLFHIDPDLFGDDQLAVLSENLQDEVERRQQVALAVAEKVWEMVGGKPDYWAGPMDRER